MNPPLNIPHALHIHLVVRKWLLWYLWILAIQQVCIIICSSHYVTALYHHGPEHLHHNLLSSSIKWKFVIFKTRMPHTFNFPPFCNIFFPYIPKEVKDLLHNSIIFALLLGLVTKTETFLFEWQQKYRMRL